MRGRALWLAAGQQLLRRGGVAEVKLQTLTDELGLTTGSFYHHFSGMAEFLEALALHYGSDQLRENLAKISDPDPRARLRDLHEFAREEHMGRLDAAMRDWSGSNPAAAKAVRASDKALLRFMERAFTDLGFSERDAETRAALLLSAGVARISPPWRTTPTAFEDLLDILAPDAG